MPSATSTDLLSFTTTVHDNPTPARLVEAAPKRGEGVLAANGALAVDTGERTGRSPKDKFLDATPGVHAATCVNDTNAPKPPIGNAQQQARIHTGCKQTSGHQRVLACCGRPPHTNGSLRNSPWPWDKMVCADTQKTTNAGATLTDQPVGDTKYKWTHRSTPLSATRAYEPMMLH